MAMDVRTSALWMTDLPNAVADGGLRSHHGSHSRMIARSFLNRKVVMRKTMLWRYYGLFCLCLAIALIVGVLNAISRIYCLEWLRRWGVEGIGALLGGLCCLLRGLDLIVFCRRYPPFLRENAPKWDSRSRRASPATLLFVGAWFTLVGLLLTYSGGWYLVSAVLDMLQKSKA